MRLMQDMQNSILDQTFPDFVREFMLLQFPKKNYPTWVVDALTDAGITLL